MAAVALLGYKKKRGGGQEVRDGGKSDLLPAA